MPTKTLTVSVQTKPQSSPLHAYHSNVMQAMCTQMADQNRRSRATDEISPPLPLAKRPMTRSSSKTSGLPTSSASKQTNLKEHVREEMARRLKADRVLQDLSSDKSRKQARERETARRNKWAKSIASACPPAEVPAVKKQLSNYHQKQHYASSKRPATKAI